MSYIDDLVEVSNDAFDNLYDVIIDLPSNVGETASLSLKIRAGDIQIPEPKREAYKIHYKTVDIDRPKPKVALERKLTLIFRLDSEYEVYKLLKKWEALNFTSQGKSKPFGAADLGEIAVKGFTSSDGIAEDGVAIAWNFTKVWSAGITTGVNFKREVYRQALEFFAPFLNSSIKERKSFR